MGHFMKEFLASKKKGGIILHNIKIWDRVEKLKGLDKSVWLNAYPQAALKTLVLVDNTTVYFLEDIKEQGFTGESDIDIVKSFLAKIEEDMKKSDSEAQEQAEKKKSDLDILKEENETLKARIDTLSATVEELVLTTLE